MDSATVLTMTDCRIIFDTGEVSLFDGRYTDDMINDLLNQIMLPIEITVPAKVERVVYEWVKSGNGS